MLAHSHASTPCSRRCNTLSHILASAPTRAIRGDARTTHSHIHRPAPFRRASECVAARIDPRQRCARRV
ncbi:hypothetical protein WS70_27035 [Burkholderia mayonis]|uniref:Uncharacterized protein n=1 Tax=Burkholderia mayonis TaxID=1385591 RepID=A0A1B4FNV3_9BURK|nr:hypothetical protein WS70_27035 [Burkholderia mayonis]KVE37505.1 hypothetical protein WS69_01730 [Burkholderia sp. BDU5]KVE47937.1 hypothetical protein WS70_25725 [Burkholderia mayonis]